VKNIPRSEWPNIERMYMHQEMSRREIAEYYKTTIVAVRTTLRAAGIQLTKEQALDRAQRRLNCANFGNKRTFEPPKSAPPYSVLGLVKAASKVTLASIDDIYGPTRPRWLVNIRHAISFLADGHYSYLHIGRCLRRDHSTIIHGCNMAKKRIPVDANFRELITAIRSEALRAKKIEHQIVSSLVTRIAA
jgi:chromosomal replication initiation ATPase DnaA